MRIKKKNHNQYLLSEANIWVRNFCESGLPCEDINELYSKDEYKTLYDNELKNLKIRKGQLEPNLTQYSNIVIVSDGYNFEKFQVELAKLPFDEVKILAVNGALAKWTMVGDKAKVKRAVSHYIANNPFIDCSQYIPTKHAYFPHCIASLRTHPKFTHNYKSPIHFYQPAIIRDYSGAMRNLRPILDDYRNPICAAVSLAYLFSVQKLLLFCCDSSFKDRRPASVELENGLFSYPQQIASQQILDACFYWLKAKEIKIGNCSSGINYHNAEYIKLERIADFFKEDEDG